MDTLKRALGALICTTVLVMSPAAQVPAQSLFDKLKDAVGDATGDGSEGGSSSLSTQQITNGLKEALRVGAERTVRQLGVVDGFNADPKVHIPLPESLRNVQGILRKAGLSGLADEVELKINRAAEEAAPNTKELLWGAVEQMTLDDAKAIYNGPEDAATQYFKRVADSDLRATVEPVVEKALNEVGAITAYDSLISRYKVIPFVPDVKTNLRDHATQKTLDGIYHYLAVEEAEIRADPAARTTDILKTVFGGG